ncbi:MAG: hypothetical protein GTO45_27615, partial [Candidatus Aminicenantes bacterium]|nr:hypothetical protein [Candidatus Aminicenantes bacterium]NIM82564.1 hypothetical protein [Candidatus Aminicenantes bacterium]NIN21924.1 hypothetical protein [Candidatus Aminicenantes bacterium]NIN45702.1 hypothetical protein [Candidatus Aminicenantes bacterium]NIN88537.1 hypothetical protein [Candidatus Aminicenantes bacterium]
MKKKVFVMGMTILFLVLSGLWPFMVSADTPGEKQVLHPLRVDVKPKIDGVLDEEIWQTRPLEKDFISYYPHIGEKFPYKTLVWMSYDRENLYFAFRCLDPEPEKIKTSITRRDSMFYDDWVGLSLDALGTKQTAWALFVNPNGIQGDILDSAVSGSDPSPDFVWESAGKVTDKGYQVEIGIPLRSIGFKTGREVKMGILFWRTVTRLGIRACWPQYIPGGKVFNTHIPIIYKDLKKPLKLELLPNIVYGSNQQRVNPQEWGEKDIFKGIGIGLKYGITSSITADVTINPDFSQVESDAFQVEVNQRYPLFYTEKRPFFMEGSDVFNFFTPPVILGTYFPTAVHTRQIMDPGWGAKLTGTAGKFALGILTAGDDQPGLPWEAGKNPHEGRQAFWGIARGKYSLGRDSYIGLFYSGREFADQYNRVFGTDMLYRFFKTHLLQVSFLHSTSSHSDSFNTPDGNPGSSNFNLMYSHHTKNVWLDAAFEHIGTDFRMDSAFLKRTGINNGMFLFLYNYIPKSKKLHWINQFTTFFFFQYVHDLNTGMDDTYLMLSLEGHFSKSTYTGVHYFKNRESWMGKTFDLNQYYYFGHIQLTKWLHLDTVLWWGDNIYYAGD